MPDLRHLNKSMPRILQYLIQEQLERKRQEGWLQKSLREYEAWGEQQEKLQQSGLKKESLLLLLNVLKKSVEDQDRPALKILEMLPQLGITPEQYPELGLPTPTVRYEEAMDPYEEATRMVMESYKDLSYPEAQAVAKMVMTKGSEFATELIQDIAKKKGERAERGVREKELTEQIEGRKLREKELGVREKELAVEKKGTPKKSTLDTRLESKRKERWAIIEKMFKGDEGRTATQVKNWEKQALALNEDIKSLKKKLGYDKPEKDPDARHAQAAKQLKAEGYTKKDLTTDEDLIAWINENNLNVWILMEYF